MIPEILERLTLLKQDLENHTLGLVIAMIQLERAKRSQRRQDFARLNL